MGGAPYQSSDHVFVGPGTRRSVARWTRRLADHDRTLSQIADAVAWPRNTARSLSVIRGTYFKLPDGVALWLEDHSFEPSNHHELVDAFAPVS